MRMCAFRAAYFLEPGLTGVMSPREEGHTSARNEDCYPASGQALPEALSKSSFRDAGTFEHFGEGMGCARA